MCVQAVCSHSLQLTRPGTTLSIPWPQKSQVASSDPRLSLHVRRESDKPSGTRSRDPALSRNENLNTS